MTATLGAVLGMTSALLAIGVAQVVAALINSRVGGPVDAVGAVVIDHTPAAVKNFAISTFGSHDKTALIWGIWIVLLICAAIIGWFALRRLRYAMAGLAIFVVLGLLASLTRPASRASDTLPTLAGGLAAALLLRYLARRPGLRPGTSPAGAGTSGAAGTANPAGAAGAAGAAEPSRRRFLLLSGTAAGAGLVVYEAGSWLASTRGVADAQRALRLPPAAVTAPPLPPGYEFNIKGLSPFITPNATFYRVDTALILPEILPANWLLRVHGMVRQEITLTFADLIRRPLVEDYITLCCVSNPVGGPYVGNAKWLGASLRSLLREAGIRAGADQLLCTSSDGFTSGVPVAAAMDGRDALVAVAMNGVPLPVAHGFPVRLVIPGLYGYVSACKWLTDIEVTTYAASTAYWAQRGWSARGPVKTESRIDVPAPGASVKSGRRTAIAGVAWAQHKGIEAVEVRIGAGPWQQAHLSAVPGIDCWRQWAYYWDAAVPPGRYLVEARATDKTGYTQTAAQAPEEPNGATGYPSVGVTVAG